MSKGTRWWCRVAAASCVALAVVALASGADAQQKLKVYVSTGFDGNTWMNASTNLLRAIAQTKAYKDRVTLEIQSARGDAQTQQQQINAMTQAGADIILGCHQHVLKGIEVYRGKAIFYGLGNFAMDVPMTEHQKNASLQEMQGRYPEHAVGYREDYPTYPFHPLARRSGIARFEVKGRRITRVGFLPCYINPSGQPEPLSPDHDRFEEVVGYVEEITAAAGLSTEFQRDGSELLVLSD